MGIHGIFTANQDGIWKFDTGRNRDSTGRWDGRQKLGSNLNEKCDPKFIFGAIQPRKSGNLKKCCELVN